MLKPIVKYLSINLPYLLHKLAIAVEFLRPPSQVPILIYIKSPKSLGELLGLLTMVVCLLATDKDLVTTDLSNKR